MRDPIETLIVNALSRLAHTGNALPLHSRDGLFPTSRAGKQAAAICRERGFLATRHESRKKKPVEVHELSHKGIAFLRRCLSETLAQLGPEETWTEDVLTYLRRRHETGTLDDCPLPALFELARRVRGDLTIGEFHDGLRMLHEREEIYLHPWTGPVYDLPEPSLALLVGHEIAYYASLRFASDESCGSLSCSAEAKQTSAEVCHECDA